MNHFQTIRVLASLGVFAAYLLFAILRIYDSAAHTLPLSTRAECKTPSVIGSLATGAILAGFTYLVYPHFFH